MAVKYIAGLLLLLAPALTIGTPEVFSTSPLLQGTKIVAGPNKDEFFILAQNENVQTIKPVLSQKTTTTEVTHKSIPLKAEPHNQPTKILLAKLTKQTATHRQPKQAMKQHTKKMTPPHWVPKLKKALADLKTVPKGPTMSTAIATKPTKTKKVIAAYHKKPNLKVKLSQKKKKVEKKSEIMTFHVTAYTSEYGTRDKKPGNPLSKRMVAKAIPVNDEKEQVIAFNAD